MMCERDAMGASASRANIQFPEVIGIWSSETGQTRIQVQWWVKSWLRGKKTLTKSDTSVYVWRQLEIDGNESDPWDWSAV